MQTQPLRNFQEKYSKKKWDKINKLVKGKKNPPTYMEINGIKIEYKQIIADELKIFFAEIGPKPSTNTSHLDYLKKSTNNKTNNEF